MGGGVVTEFALRFPDKVDGLVLLSPAGPQLKPVPVARLAQLPCIGDVAMHLFAKQVTSNYGDEFMHDVSTPPPPPPPCRCRRLASHMGVLLDRTVASTSSSSPSATSFT